MSSQLREIINEYEKNNNVQIRVTNSMALMGYKRALDKEIPFVNATYKERIAPKLSMQSCKSVIVIGVPYNKYESYAVGRFSDNAVGTDYHTNVKMHLNALVDEMLKATTFEYNICVDTGKLYERGFAIKSGLGYRGLNGCVINDKLGSYFNIGYVLVDVEIDCDKLIKKTCLECNKCFVKCPTGVLRDDKPDYKKCIAYITQKNDILSYDEIVNIKNYLYGCDDCQKCCPHNNEVEYLNYDMPTGIEILSMSNKEFVKAFNDTAVMWRGKKILQRNALACIINSNMCSSDKLEILNRFKGDDREIIRDVARKGIFIVGSR